MADGDAYVFPGYLTLVPTQLFSPKPPTTFLTCLCRGERRKYAGEKSRLIPGSNSQLPGHESDMLTTEPPGRGPESVQRRVTDYGNWLTNHVGPEQTSRVLNEIVEHVRTNYPPRQSLVVGESDSALREFTRVYTINGIEGYDARRFLQDMRQNITSVLRNNRKTKVKLILKCNMERQTNSGAVIQPQYSGTKEKAFILLEAAIVWIERIR